MRIQPHSNLLGFSQVESYFHYKSPLCAFLLPSIFIFFHKTHLHLERVFHLLPVRKHILLQIGKTMHVVHTPSFQWIPLFEPQRMKADSLIKMREWDIIAKKYE